jgi:hypothetical protein
MVPAAYADSTVSLFDTEAFDDLQGFKFGQPMTVSSQTDGAMSNGKRQVAFNDYAMISTDVIEALKDFQFGHWSNKPFAQQAASANQVGSWVKQRESVVEAEISSELEGFDLAEGIHTAKAVFIKDMKEILYGKK